MVRAIEANGIKPVVDRSFPLEALADAFRHLKAGGHFGKVCLDI
jgi:NADPH:quinone reductase-like Zn-dependent oxidoreductase